MPGLKVLIEGPGGVGKTYSLRTLVGTSVKPFVVFLEQGEDALGDVGGDDLVRKYHRPVPLNWDKMASMARNVNQFTYEMLTKMAPSDKAQNQQFINLVMLMANFTDNDGKEYGAVDSWGTDRCLVLDGLTGLTRTVIRNTIGTKPTMAPPEYGVGQNQLENFLLMLTNLNCHFVLIAHIERETDQITGGTHITVSSLGKALPPKIPPMFGEVVYARREGASFYWSTESMGVDTKQRLLPISPRLEPSFKPLVEAWVKSGNTIEPTP